jgi:hypothetical protein
MTIQQLLDHKGGYNDDPPSARGSGFAPTDAVRQIAVDLGLTTPVEKPDELGNSITQLLTTTPI